MLIRSAVAFRSMHGFVADLRQSLRGFVREPGFAAVSIVALAIGVGSSSAMFSIVDTVLLRRLPYMAPERLALLLSVDATGQRVPMGAAEFFALERHAKTIEAIGVFYPHMATVPSASGPRQARVANVSASLFVTLGIAPARGRAFEPAEDLAGAPPVAIVSDAYWRNELGADPSVLGRSLQVDSSASTSIGQKLKSVVVVGVLPRGVAFPRIEKYELFLPLAVTPEEAAMTTAREGLYGIARLQRGVSIATARAEMDSIVHATSGYGVVVEPLMQWITAEAAPALQAAFAGVLLLLVIACTNVALLLLMRGTAHGRDLAIRIALGGGQGRVVFQQIVEGVLLAVAGGTFGLGLAAIAVHSVVALAPAGIPRLNELRVDWRMAAFALAASVVSGALAGTASAWHALRSDLFQLLKEGGSGSTAGAVRSRVREALVVAQIALALVLVTGAGLLVRSLQRFSAVPLGLEPRDLLASYVYPQDASSTAAMAALLAAAKNLPGVENAALVGYLPLEPGRDWEDSVTVEGRNPTATTPDVASINWFSPGYLATARIRLIKGRDLATADGANAAPVALVNETFVDRYLSGREPIGALFGSSDWPQTTFTIVGVVRDVRQWGPAYAPVPEVYLPQLQFARNAAAYGQGATLIVRSGLPAGRIESALRAAAAPLSSHLLLGATHPVDEYLGWHFRQRRFQLDLALGFASAALGLAALGVYGSMAFSVVQRRREIAVRAALGARRHQISALVLARGCRLAIAGVALGVGGALVLSRFLAALLYGVGERDPLTIVVAALTLVAIALAASLLPARAAARLDPMSILRSE
ncbi:MAG TPA: ABC transporter permease [Myxococcales bacterium]|nr:ABC transporter permease [Myxococcales bacterium]